MLDDVSHGSGHDQTGRAEHTNGMHGIQCRLPGSLFYRSIDQRGKAHIAEADREKYNIPQLLDLKTWIGSCWEGSQYSFVQDVLSSMSYNLDGRQYARDRGRPELIRGNTFIS